MTDWKDWHIPLTDDQQLVSEAQASMEQVGAGQQEIPLIIQLIENPKFDIPGLDIFHGAVDLATHDVIHILLGRGLLPKDEAFVIGFTMGSTNRVSTVEENLYTFFAKNLYPKYYRFDDHDVRVFKDGVRLGYVSECAPLDQISADHLMPLSIREARAKIGIETDLLQAYFNIEKRRYPDCKESMRL